jgi:hypothetical protein
MQHCALLCLACHAQQLILQDTSADANHWTARSTNMSGIHCVNRRFGRTCCLLLKRIFYTLKKEAASCYVTSVLYNFNMVPASVRLQLRVSNFEIGLHVQYPYALFAVLHTLFQFLKLNRNAETTLYKDIRYFTLYFLKYFSCRTENKPFL